MEPVRRMKPKATAIPATSHPRQCRRRCQGGHCEPDPASPVSPALRTTALLRPGRPTALLRSSRSRSPTLAGRRDRSTLPTRSVRAAIAGRDRRGSSTGHAASLGQRRGLPTPRRRFPHRLRWILPVRRDSSTLGIIVVISQLLYASCCCGRSAFMQHLQNSTGVWVIREHRQDAGGGPLSAVQVALLEGLQEADVQGKVLVRSGIRSRLACV